jgi:hypothetical protein
MAYSPSRAKMEAQLAVAHRALARARDAAEAAGDAGAEEDIHGIMGEVTRVAEKSLTGKPRRSSRHVQLEIP